MTEPQAQQSDHEEITQGVDGPQTVWSWDLLKIVGKGGSSTVHKARLTKVPTDSGLQVRRSIRVARTTSSCSSSQLFAQNGQFVAVKEIQTVGYSSDQIRAIENEVDTMGGLEHRNIVKCVHCEFQSISWCYITAGCFVSHDSSRYLGTQRTEQAIYIIMEYADGGSLQHYLNARGALTAEQTVHCTYQILSGLRCLHHHGITHRYENSKYLLLTMSEY